MALIITATIVIIQLIDMSDFRILENRERIVA